MRLLLYNLIFPIAFVFYLPAFLYKLIRRGGYGRDFAERFGFFTGEKRAFLQQQNAPVWIHAVSVGETVAALNFMRQWQSQAPDKHFVLSTTTTTGHAGAAQKLPPNTVLIYCPLDFSFAVRRALKLIQPRLLIIFEVEIWPNLITQAHRRGIPVALANGRMSDSSARGYAAHRWFFAPLFSCFNALCMQTEADAARIRRVAGADAPVHICDTMKFDQVPDSRPDARRQLVLDLFGTEPTPLILTAGSTHAGEEELLAATFHELKEKFPNLKLILVPRHHERTTEVVTILKKHCLSCVLLTSPDHAETDRKDATVDVLLVNTTGELMNFYAVADLVFVGKSLAGNEGGHNIIEPAIFGKAIMHGAAMQNFRQVAQIFAEAGAAMTVQDEREFRGAVARLLDNAAARAELGSKARAVVEQHRGAVDRTIDILTKLGSESCL